jgi:hypothetical protein
VITGYCTAYWHILSLTIKELKITQTLNFAVEWLASLLSIWKVLGSNITPGTGYPEFFVVSLRQMPEEHLKLGHDCFLPHIFHFIIHLLSYHLMLHYQSC